MKKSVSDILSSMGINFRRLAISSARKRNKKKVKRTLKRFCYTTPDEGFNPLLMEKPNMNDRIFLGASDVIDMVTAEILKTRIDLDLSTLFREVTIFCNRKKWSNYIEDEYSSQKIFQSSKSEGCITFDNNNYVTFSTDNITTVKVYGDKYFVNDFTEKIKNKFGEVSCYIDWVYSSEGQSINVPLNRDKLPIDEMYPFLNGESLESYYDRYIESSANILLLIGPTGTGKTTFIRGLLSYTNMSALVTYDASILEKDYIFARFIEEDGADILILEDSDAFLKSRSDGNTMMHRFLNVGDGLVTTKGKKLIFSTNLPSIRDVDSALIRPGRCFDVLSFDALNRDNANKLATKLEITSLEQDKEKYSLAEIFNKRITTEKAFSKNKLGFY